MVFRLFTYMGLQEYSSNQKHIIFDLLIEWEGIASIIMLVTMMDMIHPHHVLNHHLNSQVLNCPILQ